MSDTSPDLGAHLIRWTSHRAHLEKIQPGWRCCAGCNLADGALSALATVRAELVTMTAVAKSNKRALEVCAEESVEALTVLALYADDEPCSRDRHGYCQEHGLSGGDGVECRNVRAARLLAHNKPTDSTAGIAAPAVEVLDATSALAGDTDPSAHPETLCGRCSGPDVGVCGICLQPVHRLNAPSGSRWAHDTHPADNHDVDGVGDEGIAARIPADTFYLVSPDRNGGVLDAVKVTGLALIRHGYTSHGHPCCDEAPVSGQPALSARCGGPRLFPKCDTCRADASAIHAGFPIATDGAA